MRTPPQGDPPDIEQSVRLAVERLPGIQEHETRQLTSAGFNDVDALWRAVEGDGFAKLAARTKVAEARLAALLGGQEASEARRREGTASDRAWEVMLHLMWLLLIAVLIAGAHYVVLGSVRRLWTANRATTYAVVSAPDGLPAFSILRKDEVKVLTGPTTERELAEPASLAGRYTLVPLRTGAAIRRDQVADRMADGPMDGRTVLSLNVNAGNLPALEPPQRVTLLFSPLPGSAATGATPEIVEALLLNVRRLVDRTSVDVALMPSDLPTIARVAGQSLLIVSTQQSRGGVHGDRQNRQ